LQPVTQELCAFVPLKQQSNSKHKSVQYLKDGESLRSVHMQIYACND